MVHVNEWGHCGLTTELPDSSLHAHDAVVGEINRVGFSVGCEVGESVAVEPGVGAIEGDLAGVPEVGAMDGVKVRVGEGVEVGRSDGDGVGERLDDWGLLGWCGCRPHGCV